MLVSTKRTNQKGFSVAELVVAMTAASVIALGLVSAMVFFFADVIRGETEAQLIVESQNILREVVDDLRTSSNVLDTNTVIDDNEPVGGWTTSNDDHIIIMSQPAVDSDNEFIIDVSGTGGPYQNEFIYYSEPDSLNLYKRILANTNASGNVAATTCPAAAVTASCREDRLLSENFQDMTFVFYDQNNTVTASENEARSVEITISMFRSIFGRDIALDNNIRVTLRNSNN